MSLHYIILFGINYPRGSSSEPRRRRPDARQVEEPATEVYPDGHAAHDVDPGYIANVFTGQLAHAVLAVCPVFGFALPTGQTVIELLINGDVTEDDVVP